jgi:hypothetical protein
MLALLAEQGLKNCSNRKIRTNASRAATIGLSVRSVGHRSMKILLMLAKSPASSDLNLDRYLLVAWQGETNLHRFCDKRHVAEVCAA